jgi:hypothetical protein
MLQSEVKSGKKRQNKNGKDEFYLPFFAYYENNSLHFLGFL